MGVDQAFSAYGPSGIVLVLGLAFLRTVLPWVKQYLDTQNVHMKAIADAVVEIKNQQIAFGQQLVEVCRDLDDVQLDMARVYELQRGEGQPSRQRRRAALGAS